uniref:Uncharacterized protein n=1 Tax=Daphnia galeata TaxID=27404 RepID=A0A8J2RRI6_9CRUS|nr:unnamed protein product [Daphnia galeata]
MEVLAIKLIEGLLEELTKTNAISVSIAGPLKDSATVAFPTFLGGLVGGPGGAVMGAMAGTGILGISKALGFGNYKPLMTALREDFTEQERNSLYERLWEKLKAFVVSPLNQAMAYSALTELSQTAAQNPEVMENIRNELKETLSKKNMVLC